MTIDRQHTDAAAKTEAAFVAAVTAFRDVPGVEVFDKGDLIRTVANGRPYTFLNAVLRLTLEPAAVAERVQVVGADYRSRGLPVSWWLSAASRPTDLDRRLGTAGLIRVEDDEGMVIDLEPWPDRLEEVLAGRHADLAIHEVANEGDLVDWITATAASYGWADRRKAQHLGVLYHPRRAPRAGRRQFLARLDGHAVATASLFDVDGVAWVTNIGTIPDARGRGVGASITAHCLAVAAEQGHAHAWLAASAMGVPLYRRLGFVGTGPLVAYGSPSPR